MSELTEALRKDSKMDMVERVARAIAASDEANASPPCACSGKEKPSDFACSCRVFAARRRAKVAIAASHPALLETALLRIQSAIGKYLNPGDPMTEAEFIDEVLAAADDQEVVRAMEGKK